MLLDIKTLYAILMVSNLIMAFSLLYVFHGRRVAAAGKWVAFYVFQGLGEFLILLRGIIPDLVSIVIANTLLSATYALCYAAFAEFFGRRVRRSLIIVPPALSVAAFYTLQGNTPARFAAGGLIFGAQILPILALLWIVRKSAEHRSIWLLLASYGIAAALFFGRALSAVLSPASFDTVFAGGITQSVTLSAAFAAILLSSFSLLLMYRERADADNQRLATLDSLTELYNRRSFTALARRELARRERATQSLSLAMIDLDYFKDINDTYGHPTGDKALLAVIDRIKECLRRQDVLGRYGGDEFCLLLPDTEEQGAFSAIDRLREAVGRTAVEVDKIALRLTVSAGVSTLPRGSAGTLESLIDGADRAMLAAKNAGRNRVVQLPATASD